VLLGPRATLPRTFRAGALAMEPGEWEGVAADLPTGPDEAAVRRRKELFVSFDPNGNGILSLAEVDKGLRKTLEPRTLPPQVVGRAFHAARAISPPVADFSDDYIDAKEFRFFLLYLHHYLRLWTWFCKVDSSGDGRLGFEEFTSALPLLTAWLPGAALEGIAQDPSSAFAEMDADGGGMVLFDEFAHWVLCRGLGELTDTGADCPDRRHALELLQQNANLASADDARRKADRARARSKTPKRPPSREGPTARQLSANRQAAAKAKAKAHSSRSLRALPGRDRPSARREARTSPRAPGARSTSRQATSAQRSASLGTFRPRPQAVQRSAESTRRSPSRSHTAQVYEHSPAAALASGRHSGAKSQAILAGGYDREYF